MNEFSHSFLIIHTSCEILGKESGEDKKSHSYQIIIRVDRAFIINTHPVLIKGILQC